MPDSIRSRPVFVLQSTAVALWHGYDVAMVDLDGVVYRGGAALASAPERLTQLRGHGLTVAFVTNNASRTPAAVAAQLRALGVDAADADVVTSAQAAARVVAGMVPAGSRVLVVGGEGLRQALLEHRLIPIASAEDDPAAVVQGFAPEVGWALLAEAAYAVAAEVPWVASNLDQTLPTERGIAPGNGTLVAAVAATSQRMPVVAGKPEPALFDETVIRVGGNCPLIVGDRLDTDVAGANRVGADSLLVLTGVTDLDRLAAATPLERPTFVSADLGGLEVPHLPPVVDGTGVTCGQWRVEVVDHELWVERGRAAEPPAERDVVDLVRAAVTAAWRHLDSNQVAVSMSTASARLHEMMQGHAGRADEGTLDE